jgi:hypothetical protein
VVRHGTGGPEWSRDHGPGHVEPVEQRAFCGLYGAEAVMSCEDCEAPIRGYYHADVAVALPMGEPPAFFDSCGSPYL